MFWPTVFGAAVLMACLSTTNAQGCCAGARTGLYGYPSVINPSVTPPCVATPYGPAPCAPNPCASALLAGCGTPAVSRCAPTCSEGYGKLCSKPTALGCYPPPPCFQNPVPTLICQFTKNLSILASSILNDIQLDSNVSSTLLNCLSDMLTCLQDALEEQPTYKNRQYLYLIACLDNQLQFFISELAE